MVHNRAATISTHPAWETPSLCEVHGPDVEHRQVPDFLSARGDPSLEDHPDPDAPTVSWALEQDDELRDGRQDQYPPCVALGIDGTRVRLSLDEARTVAVGMLERVAQASGEMFGLMPLPYSAMIGSVSLDCDRGDAAG